MRTDEQHENLARRLNRIAGTHGKLRTIENFRAIVGGKDENAPQAAALAREKLQAGARLTETEWKALELMIRLSRPTALIRCGVPEPLPSGKPSRQFPGWKAFRAKIAPYIHSVGLILPGTGRVSSRKGIGTGFLVRPDVLVTNYHVFNLLKVDGGAPQGSVRFLFEDDNYENEPVITVKRAIYVAPKDDLAALKLSVAGSATPLELDKSGAQLEMQVVAIGHPFKDSERNPKFISSVFGDKLFVKRASPGEITPARNGDADMFDHDCSTLGGNSGSPIVSIDSGKVVGVHREGLFLERNTGIRTEPLISFLSKCKV